MSDNFDTNRFLDRVAGPGIQPVLAAFESAGVDGPSYDMVRKWRSRDSMPALWLAKMLLALEVLEGKPVSMRVVLKEASSCLSERRSFSGLPPSVFD